MFTKRDDCVIISPMGLDDRPFVDLERYSNDLVTGRRLITRFINILFKLFSSVSIFPVQNFKPFFHQLLSFVAKKTHFVRQQNSLRDFAATSVMLVDT